MPDDGGLSCGEHARTGQKHWYKRTNGLMSETVCTPTLCTEEVWSKETKQRNKGKCHYPALAPSIPKFYIFKWLGPRLGSLLFWGVECDRPSLNPSNFSEKILCFLLVLRQQDVPNGAFWGTLAPTFIHFSLCSPRFWLQLPPSGCLYHYPLPVLQDTPLLALETCHHPPSLSQLHLHCTLLHEGLVDI